MEKLNKFTEMETKYKVDGGKIYQFKEIIQNIGKEFEFLYIEGSDFYFTRHGNSFLRYRKSPMEKSGKAELTLKQKSVGSSNNRIRKEVNLGIGKNSYETVKEFATMIGFEFNFEIYKMCHIYFFDDGNLVFYTVTSEGREVQHFVEIELDESKIHTLTEDQAWAKIRYYEAFLEPLGITYRNRLNKSLFEMYVKDIYKKEENILPIKTGEVDG
jgi:hypothetical protein